jgi:hypothetical protein
MPPNETTGYHPRKRTMFSRDVCPAQGTKYETSRLRDEEITKGNIMVIRRGGLRSGQALGVCKQGWLMGWLQRQGTLRKPGMAYRGEMPRII